jgi:hypothetical protein
MLNGASGGSKLAGQSISVLGGPKGGWRKSLRSATIFFPTSFKKLFGRRRYPCWHPIDLAGVIGCSGTLLRKKLFILNIN